MATREFEAQHIHDRAVVALEGLEKKMEADWIESCKRPYELQLAYVNEYNAHWWTRLWNKTRKTILPFEQYCQERKNWEDYWSFSDWRHHKERPYQQDRSDLRRIRNLAAENAKASKMIVMTDTDYRDITLYEKWA